MKDSSHSSLRVRTGSWLWLVYREARCTNMKSGAVFWVVCWQPLYWDTALCSTHMAALQGSPPPPTHTHNTHSTYLPSLILWSPVIVIGSSTTRHKMDFVFFSPVLKVLLLISFIIWVDWRYIQNKVKCKSKHISPQNLNIKKTKLNGNVFSLKKTLSWTPGSVHVYKTMSKS